MLRSTIAGALSGAVVTSSIWTLAEFAWDAISSVAGGILSMGFGGPAPPPPTVSYDWAAYGFVVGLTAGAAVGLCAGQMGPGLSGRAVGMFTAAALWTLHAAVLVFVTGSGVVDVALFVLLVLGGSVLLGALAGALTDWLFRRSGRRAGVGSD